MAEVELRDVTKRYGATVAVAGLDLCVRDHEVMAVVGPSGCGKSTMLRLIAGLERPSSGEIRIGSRLVQTLRPRERDVAMVFQNLALYGHLTVYENLAFGLRMRGVPREAAKTRVLEAAHALGLIGQLRRKPDQLSGGERQRVAVGRAVVRQPAVYLLDEPLSHLDAPLRATLRDDLLQLCRRAEAPVIYVTHDQAEAMWVGDRVAVMDGGRLQQTDTPRRIYEAPANRAVAAFIGSPPMNIFRAISCRENGHVGVKIGRRFLPWPRSQSDRLTLAEGTTLDLGIRPEHVKLSASSESTDDWRITARVVACRTLGAETIVQLTSDELSANFQIRIVGACAASVSSVHEIGIPTANLHIFDSDQGVRISKP